MCPDHFQTGRCSIYLVTCCIRCRFARPEAAAAAERNSQHSTTSISRVVPKTRIRHMLSRARHAASAFAPAPTSRWFGLLARWSREELFHIGDTKHENASRFSHVDGLIFACRFLNILIFTSTVFCAFGVRRLVSRGELGWILPSFAALGVVDTVSRLTRLRVTEKYERAVYDTLLLASNRSLCAERIAHEWRLFAQSEAALAVSGSRQNYVDAVAYAVLITACFAHSAYVRYIDEADAFSALILTRACVRALVSARRAKIDSARRVEFVALVTDNERSSHRGPSVSTSALVENGGELVAIVGDGRYDLFNRLIRGVEHADEVDVLLSPSKEWRVPEPVDRRVNALVLGSASSRVDALKRSRLIESLEAALCSSDRYLECALRKRPKETADDVIACSTSDGGACEIGLERARCAHARIMLAQDPFYEIYDERARLRAMNRLTNRRRSCVFTTTDIAVLPLCHRIVITEGNSVVFIGKWSSMLEGCDAHTIHRALSSSSSRRQTAPIDKSRVIHPSPREFLAAPTKNVAASMKGWNFQSVSLIVSIFACVGITPAISLHAFERWLDGKRRMWNPSNVLLYAAIGTFVASIAMQRIVAHSLQYSRTAHAFARVIYVALAAGFTMTSAADAAVAFAFTVFIAWSVDFNRLASRLNRQCENDHVRLAHFVARVSQGARQIRVSRCQYLYWDTFKNLLAALCADNRRRRKIRGVQHAWSSLCAVVGIAVGLSALDQSETSRRGALAFIGLQAVEVFIDLTNRDSLFDARRTHTVETQTGDSRPWLRRTRSSS